MNEDMRFTFLFLLACAVALAGCATTPATDNHDHDAPAAEAMETAEHAHTNYELPEGVAAPTVEVTVEHDLLAGYNVHVTTTNFEWTPQNVNTRTVPGTGHAHLYVDGKKIARLYGQDFHFDGPSEVGRYTVRVELNTNMHETYVVNGVPVSDSAFLVVDHLH
jgi:hypothetical protein